MRQNQFLQKRGFAAAAAVFCTLLWGTAFPFIKLGYAAFAVTDDDIGAKLLFAGLRFFIAGLMVLIFLCAREKRLVLPEKSALLPVAALGAVQTFGQYLFTYIGIGFTTGANTSIITACASFLTVAGAAVFFKSDRLTVLKILNLIAKKISADRSPVKITAYQLLFGGAALCAAGLVCGGRLNMTSGQGVLILLWLAFVSAAAFTVWTALLRIHPASKISVFNLLVPIFGTVLSGLLLGENILKIETLLSLLLIAAGILLVNFSKGGKKHDKSGHFGYGRRDARQ